MNKQYKVAMSIPIYKLSRRFGYPKPLPLNLTVSLTYHCNSRCKTCNVWKKKVDELNLEEFDAIFKNIGKEPYIFTLSGGEPFLRKDIDEICLSIHNNCMPGIITIPTNGLLHNIIPGKVQKILENCPDTRIIINISLDGIGHKHDDIRCIVGNYEKTINTYKALKDLKHPNLEIGIHTVISRFNVTEIQEIYKHFQTLCPDSYITEIAEERVELDTIGTGITPDIEDYHTIIDFVSGEMRKQNVSGISKLTKCFRLQYYDIVKKTLREKKQIIPCYAGYTSGHIAPNGDVWMCCIKADPIGNLRDSNYDLKKLWFGERAKDIRKSIKNGDCYCTLANASYTNMLCDIRSLSNVMLNMIR